MLCLLYLGILRCCLENKDEKLCCKVFGSCFKAALKKFPRSLQFSKPPKVSPHKRGSLNGFSLLTGVPSLSSRWDLISTKAGMSLDFFWKHLPTPSPGLCSDLISSDSSSDWAPISETEGFFLFSQMPQFPPSPVPFQLLLMAVFCKVAQPFCSDIFILSKLTFPSFSTEAWLCYQQAVESLCSLSHKMRSLMRLELFSH